MAFGDEIRLFDEEEYATDGEEKFELKLSGDDGDLIKSKERVQHHGEVFTPKWMVKKMLSEPAIQKKLRDLHATFLEPSAGEGAFLKEILHQKLNYVDEISSKTSWKSNALWALMSIYGIELLPDNLTRARAAMLDVFVNHYQVKQQKSLSANADLDKAAKYVIEANIVQGNTLEYVDDQGRLIELSHWVPVGDKVQREPFTYKSLFNNNDAADTNAQSGQLSLFGEEETKRAYKICELTKVYKGEKINE